VKYILDTNTLSRLMRGEARFVERLTSHPRCDVLLPQPVVAEIAFGLARMRQSARRDRLRERFAVFLGELNRAEWTDRVSRAFGKIKADLEKAGARLEDFDVAIGAHALAAQATLVTGNARHMKRIRGLRVEDWSADS